MSCQSILKDLISFLLLLDVSEYEYQPGEEPTQMPKPDERGWKQVGRRREESSSNRRERSETVFFSV